MNRPLAALFFVFALSAMPLQAAPIVFTTTLSGPNEEPPNPSPGTGFAMVTIDPVAHTLGVDVTFQNLTTPNTAAHIHVINGPGDTNTADTLGPVATTTPTFTGFPSNVTAGSFSSIFDTTMLSTYRAGFVTDAGGTALLAEAALFSGIQSGRAYLNIHTTLNPGGEIRGFLQPVPEPASLLLLGSGLALAERVRRRRRGSSQEPGAGSPGTSTP